MCCQMCALGLVKTLFFGWTMSKISKKLIEAYWDTESCNFKLLTIVSDIYLPALDFSEQFLTFPFRVIIIKNIRRNNLLLLHFYIFVFAVKQPSFSISDHNVTRVSLRVVFLMDPSLSVSHWLTSGSYFTWVLPFGW